MASSTQLTVRGDRTPILDLGMLREDPALNEAELVDLMDKKNPLITGGKNVLRDVYKAANFNLDGNFDY